MIRQLTHLFRAIGGYSSNSPKPRARTSDLLLSLPLERTIKVGTLHRDDDGYVFQYAKEFAESHLPLLPDFPRIDDTYRSPELWPFFAVRLPPVDRPDVKAQIEKLNIDKDDTLKLLGSLGQRVISSPYELTPLPS